MGVFDGAEVVPAEARSPLCLAEHRGTLPTETMASREGHKLRLRAHPVIITAELGSLRPKTA